SSGAATRSIFSRIAVTAPVISSTVSPRTRNAINSPPICEGVASPAIMRSKPRAASSRLSVAPVAALAMSALKSSVKPTPLNSSMVARRLEWPVDAAQDAQTPMLDQRELAVHRHRRAHHPAAENLPDRLVAKADAENRDGRRRLGNEIEADARIGRRAWTR